MKKGQLYKTLLGVLTSAVVIVSTVALNPIDAYAAHSVSATVTGTVQKGTDSNTLYLRTPQGDMIIKLDPDTETSCKLLLPGSTIYVGVYYGNDEYMHAATISASNNTAVDTSAYKTSTVTGTIADKPMDNNIMYVNLGDDQMHLKIDGSTQYNCGVLYAGKKVNIEVYRGDDAYMHALKFTDAGGSSSTAAGPSSVYTPSGEVKTTPVTGTVTKNSTSSMLYLSAKEGTYQLKIDGNTNFANGYMCLAGKKVTAYIYRGDDAYMHVAAVNRTGELSATSSGSTQMTVTGTVMSDSTDGTMYLNTSGGKMSIRLDANTQFNSSRPIYTSTKVSVACVSCSDEYWHATSISVIE